MKLFSAIILASLLIISCQQNQSNPNKSNKTTSEAINSGQKGAIDQLKIQVEALDSSIFAKALLEDPEQILTDRLCKESKGYNKNDWPGMNACEWSTEKHYLARDTDFANRKEDLLVLKLQNGKISGSYVRSYGYDWPITGTYDQKTGKVNLTIDHWSIWGIDLVGTIK